MPAPTKDVGASFYNKITPEPNTGCHIWAASLDSVGYGLFGIRRKLFKAHRVAWMLCKGAVPEGLCVLHKCDTPSCVNPDHLFLGTHADNMADKKRKGRVSRTRIFGTANHAWRHGRYAVARGGA